MLESLSLVPSNLLWGVAFGAAASAAGIPLHWAAAMSAVVWSGTAQMTAVGMLGQPVAAIFLASLIVHLRFVPMSLALGAKVPDLPRWQRGLLSCLLADASFALLARIRERPIAYLVGTWLLLYSSWLVGTAVGTLSAPLLPQATLSLSDAVVAAIIAALAVESCTNSRMLLIAGVAGLVAAVGSWALPPGVAVLVASLSVSGGAAWLKQH